jgi:hypothetical protein
MVCSLLVALAAATPVPGQTPTAAAASLPRQLHEGVDTAVRLLNEAGRLLEAGEEAAGQARLEAALDADPWMAEAWANRGIQAHRRSAWGSALLSYRMALALDPGMDPARQGLASLPPEPAPSDVSPEFEEQLGRDLTQAVAALTLARELRTSGRALRAAALLEACRWAGGAHPGLPVALAEAYEAAGWTKDALDVLVSVSGEETNALTMRLESRLQEVDPLTRAALEALEGDLAPHGPDIRELTESVARRMAGSESRVEVLRARLLRWLRFRRGDRMDLGGLRLPLGDRWYRATIEPTTGRPPDHLIRRWPGDTQVAGWVVPLPGAGVEALVGDLARLLPGIWSGTDRLRQVALGPLAYPAWAGQAHAELTGVGEQVLPIWLVPHADQGCATVLVAITGPAGAGSAGAAEAHADLVAALEGMEPRPQECATVGKAVPLALPVPPEVQLTGPPPDEKSTPWRTVAAGTVHLDVPPGVLGRPVGPGSPAPPGQRPGTVALFRGSFTDREGIPVVIGDVTTCGYLDLWSSEDPENEIAAWIEGPGEDATRRPVLRGDPGADWLRGIDYSEAAGPPTGAGQVALARFSGGRFGGTWLAARLRFGEVMAEVGVPLLEGEQSLAAFWIPTTIRSAQAPPPPPPVDLSAKYDIRFVTIDSRDRSLLRLKAGDLVADELRMMVPAGWRVALSSRKELGFPVRLRPGTGGALIVLERLAGQVGPLAARRDEMLHRMGLSPEALQEWRQVSRPGRHRAEEGYSGTMVTTGEDGRRRQTRLLLLRPAEGRADFLLRAEAPEGEWTAALEQMVEVTFGSLRFRKGSRR